MFSSLQVTEGPVFVTIYTFNYFAILNDVFGILL